MSILERRLREREERSAAIRRAALQVFASKGLQEATMDEIAQAAELGKATLYYYFDSKESLIEALIESNLSLYFDGLLDTSATSLFALGQGIVERLLERFAHCSEAFKVLYWVLAERELKVYRAAEAFRRAHRAWLDQLEVHVEPLIAATPGLSAQAFVDFIGSHLHGIILLAVAGRELSKIREESGRLLRAFLK